MLLDKCVNVRVKVYQRLMPNISLRGVHCLARSPPLPRPPNILTYSKRDDFLARSHKCTFLPNERTFHGTNIRLTFVETSYGDTNGLHITKAVCIFFWKVQDFWQRTAKIVKHFIFQRHGIKYACKLRTKFYIASFFGVVERTNEGSVCDISFANLDAHRRYRNFVLAHIYWRKPKAKQKQ